MIRREKDIYVITDLTGRQTRTKNLKYALKLEHSVNISSQNYDKYNKALLKEVRNTKRDLKKLYEQKRLND